MTRTGKTIFAVIVLSAIFVFSSISAHALDSDSGADEEEIISRLYEDVGADKLIFELPESAKNIMNELGISYFTPGSADNLSINGIISVIGYVIKSNIYEPLKILLCVIGIILLTALFDTFKNGSSSDSLENVLNAAAVLCTVTVISPSLLELISQLSETIVNSSNFMSLYVPVITVLAVTSGGTLSGAAFYTAMIYISSAISQISSKIIVPLLKCVLSLSIVSSVSDKVSLEGFISLFRKIVKWLLCFCMSLFVAFMTMKTIVTTAEDTISNKVAKFAINSFVPIVGGALSDAYQTVIGCVGVLKSGVGVVAMIAIFAIFLPAVMKCAVWQAAIAISCAVGEVFSVKKICTLLSSIEKILSSINAILLSIMVIYIVSTAIIIIVGG